MEENPFSVGDQVIIALQPQEISSKLIAKWKGPFVIKKVPNRFQIVYIEKISHISFARKYFSKYPITRNFALQFFLRESSQLTDVDDMGRLLLRLRGRCVLVGTLPELQRLDLGVLDRVSVVVTGQEEDLPEELKEVWRATGPEGKVFVEVLRGLMGLRPKMEGGCDVSPSTPLEEDLLLSDEEEVVDTKQQ